MTMTKPNIELNVMAHIGNIGTIETNVELIKEQALAIQEWYKNLYITKEMLDDIKTEKANINKVKNSVAEYRKNIIAEFKKPIDVFEKTAKETEKILAETYDIINEQVKRYEDEEKAKKSKEVEEYFNEYAESLNIDFVNYAQASINVTLTASIKSLKESAKGFLDKIQNDLMLIDTQDNKIEILAEYKRTLDVSGSIMRIKQRIEAEARERERQEILRKAKLEQEQIVKKVEEVTTPKEVEVVQEEILSMNFKVYGTIDQLREVKHFLDMKGIKYDTNK